MNLKQEHFRFLALQLNKAKPSNQISQREEFWVPGPPILHLESFVHHIIPHCLLKKLSPGKGELRVGILFSHLTLAQTVRNTETLTSLFSDQEAVTWEFHDLRLEFICLSTKFPVSIRLSKRFLLFPSSLVLWQSVLSLSS